MRLRVMDFIRRSFPDSSGDEKDFEYRLLCSGTLHREIVGDWTRSDIARVLSPEYFELFICNGRIEEYPQELSLQFSCPTVEEKYGNFHFSHRPHQEIVGDLAALLSLFSRRLVTVVGNVREFYKKLPPDVPETFRDWPSPLYGVSWFHWPSRPATVITTPERIEGEWRVRQEVHSHSPEPVPVNPDTLTEFLKKVAGQDENLATRVIMAARRYHEALRYIPENADLSYLLLISEIDAIAGKALETHKPTMEDMLRRRNDLVGHLRSLSLQEEEIRQTIEIVNKDNPWTREKFSKFIEQHINNDVFDPHDPLYPGLELHDLVLEKKDLGKVLSRIYRKRSARSHGGVPYPVYITIGTSPFIREEAFRSMIASSKSDKVPPVIWFERAAHKAINGYIETL
jgi:hypothetical protein